MSVHCCCLLFVGIVQVTSLCIWGGRNVWEAAERTRTIDRGYKEAKEFSDAYTDLNNWLENAVKPFDETAHTLGKDPDKIKQDALQALLDWLCKVDLPLMKEGPVYGDLDTVIFFKEQQKNCEDEFNGRLSQANQVRKTAT
ncbi:hypothetical protein QYM36_001915 [Artemia franciscana]|uniref:Secreted protein n=1 Tax=Artemia franciscana TaxID=6661 RepID=A0AA88LED9_ARTSF|nr:hypothetical protein QYM36_001915 [Artemia franciscana]